MTKNEPIATLTRAVGGGDTVEIPELGARFDVLDIPGHTRAHIAYYGGGALFCGDTLFACGCGRLFEGDMMRIIIADEISPDSCRLWDIATQEKMDKDRFRRDLGGLLEAYQEVARRLGIINENEPPRGTGPVLVK